MGSLTELDDRQIENPRGALRWGCCRSVNSQACQGRGPRRSMGWVMTNQAPEGPVSCAGVRTGAGS